MSNQEEVTITFTGVPGSGKTTFQILAEKAFKKAGHHIVNYNDFAPHSLTVRMNREAVKVGALTELGYDSGAVVMNRSNK